MNKEHKIMILLYFQFWFEASVGQEKRGNLEQEFQ